MKSRFLSTLKFRLYLASGPNPHWLNPSIIHIVCDGQNVVLPVMASSFCYFDNINHLANGGVTLAEVMLIGEPNG